MAVPENILVVDDKPDNLRLLSNILTKEGYKVRKVLSGRLAIEAARLHPPDLILLDIMMPEPDGYQVCQDLKANQQTREIPIIFLSALDTVADKVKAFTIGGVDFIPKPFQQEEVLARVRIHLQIRKLNCSLQHRNALLKQEIKQRRKAEAELQRAMQELKETQEQVILKEKLASLGALTAGIAHELRNPLNFVNNYAEGSMELVEDLLSEIKAEVRLEPTLLSSLQEMLSEIHSNAITIRQHGQRAERIIYSMMQHARTEQSDRRLTDLNVLLQEASNLAYHSKRAQNPAFNITIHSDYDATIGLIEIAPSDLSRAFINLIDNACYAVYSKQQQATDYTPTLWLTTERLPHHVVIKIRDNGSGIKPEIQRKIFDPFFTTKANEGTGLGLSITYDIIVNRHRGTLTVQSELDVYTEFVATIPL